MTFRPAAALCALVALAACDGGNPLVATQDPTDGTESDATTTDDTTTDDSDGEDSPEADDTTDTGTGVESDGALPPGTAEPTPDASIFRLEPEDAEAGDGFVTGVRYDSGTDTFTVSGLPFDGEQPGAAWDRATPGALNGYALYEAPLTVPDAVTGAPVGQLQHRALYGVSASGQTEFAIVRTGSYVDYGFGGFVYQRDGGVVIPEAGQGIYRGDYAAIRDFDGRGGMEYADGSMEVRLDFGGFQGNCTGAGCGTAVLGIVSDRVIYDTDGTDITQSVLDAINANATVPQTALPPLVFEIDNQSSDANGELSGSLDSTLADGTAFEQGNYYALMSGDHANGSGGEIVGVLVSTAQDPRFSSVTTRETGGFIVTRVQP